MNINVGLIGLGTVGSGMVKILQANNKLIKERLGALIILKKIADKDIDRPRPLQLDKEILTTNVNEVLDDPEISIVVELIGGYEPAKTFILRAIENGKHVVTANKALLATHGREIFTAAAKRKVDIGFEASVGGGIPIIKAIKEGLVANNIGSIFGIMNGTANYILSRMTNEGISFRKVLKEAQHEGYAEADPTLDVEGVDTAHKLAICISLAYGIQIKLKDIYTEGISKIDPIDLKFADEFGYRIKLLAISRSWEDGVEARVHPTMIPKAHILSNVGGVYNAFQIMGDSVGHILLCGLGAGMMPAGSAVVSDLVDLSRNIVYGSIRRVPLLSYQDHHIKHGHIRPIDELITHYYFRFSAVDRPGVLSKISGILGQNNISISSVIQKGRQIKGLVPIVMMTHEAKEANVRKALAEINKLDVVKGKTVIIRVEQENLGRDLNP